MIQKPTNSLLKFPLRFVMTFLITTLIMFTFSPWEWDLPNYFIFYIFNIAVLLAFFLGYNSAFRNYKYRQSKPINHKKWINRSIILGLISIYPRFLIFHGVNSLSFRDIFNRIALGVVLPSSAYSEKHLGDTNYNTLSNPISLLNFLTVPFLYFILFIGLFYWQKLNNKQKIGYVFILISHILIYISIGTNKGLFDLIIVFPFILIAKNPKLLNIKRLLLSGKMVLITIIVGFLTIVALGFFVKGNKERKLNYFYTETSTGKSVNDKALILRNIPDNYKDGYIALDNYLTQGYYALGLALDMEFVPCYGFGNSFFFTSLASKVVGKGTIDDRTYQHRLEVKHGYSHFGKWHTLYVWLANDVSFIFVPVIIYFIGFFFARSWIDVILYKNMFSVVVFSMLAIMVFYFPANNQIMGFQGSAITLILFFILWRKNRNT